jgi:beta,beta-carotene 9',10'-dioxygenase
MVQIGLLEASMSTTVGAATRSTGFRNLEEETRVDSVPVTGGVPDWLTGSLVRVTPAVLDAGDKPLRHWFDGVAMLNAFAFGNGRVSYASRFLDTEYRRRAAAGEARFGFATDPCRSLFKRMMAMREVERFDNTNVNLQQLGERYIAMTETPMPVEFDAQTLDTLGGAQWRDRVGGQVTTAHPHYDFATDEVVNYTVRFGPRTSYAVYAAAQVGGPRRLIGSLPVKKPAYMHSFGMSERYVVLAENPLVVNPLAMPLSKKGFIHNYRWEPERGTRFVVIDRRTGDVQGIHEAEPFFCFHHVNSFERDGELVVDLVAYDDPAIIDLLEVEKLRGGDYDDVQRHSSLRRYRVALDGSGVAREDLAPGLALELPRINYAANNMRDYRFTYAAAASPQGDWFDQVVKVDVTTGDVRTWSEAGCYPGEPVFVERPGGSGEDDGVLLSVVLDSSAERSFLLIVDAQTFEEVARAEAPHHIPFGFHGQYFS